MRSADLTRRAAPQDFWADSGFALCTRDSAGWLVPTDDYWRHLLWRPELAPLADSPPDERRLHTRLLERPRLALVAGELAALSDPDTRENFTHFLRFRDALRAAGTLERYYLELMRSRQIDIPPVLIDAMVAAIVRNVLHGTNDAFEARAGEAFFRTQRTSSDVGRTLLADQRTLEMYADSGGFGDLGRLLRQQNTPTRAVQMDILNAENVPFYWLRDSLYCFVLDVTSGSAGSVALGRVLARWIAHLLGVAVEITPQTHIDDRHWRWHIGLDAIASRRLNDLYAGVPDTAPNEWLALFTLRFVNPADARSDVAHYPVYLGMACASNRVLRLKPQNVLLNLPLAVRN
jgi:hypothetical protein